MTINIGTRVRVKDGHFIDKAEIDAVGTVRELNSPYNPYPYIVVLDDASLNSDFGIWAVGYASNVYSEDQLEVLE